MVTLTELQCKVMEYILHTMSETGMPPTLREIASHFGWKAVGSAQDVVLALRKKGALLPPAPGKSRQLVPSGEALAHLEENGFKVPYKGREAALARAGGNTNGTGRENQGEVVLPRVRRTAIAAERGAGARLPIRPEDAASALENFVFAPLVGLVQAGNPVEAVDSHAGEYVPFPPVGKSGDDSRFFAVTVEGYSMMNVGFMPGDMLLVESARSARNGDIVLASVGNHEVTVKRFALRGSHLYRNAFEKLPKEEFSLTRIPPALLVPENPDFEPIPFGLSDSDRVLGYVRSLYRRDIL